MLFLYFHRRYVTRPLLTQCASTPIFFPGDTFPQPDGSQQAFLLCSRQTKLETHDLELSNFFFRRGKGDSHRRYGSSSDRPMVFIWSSPVLAPSPPAPHTGRHGHGAARVRYRRAALRHRRRYPGDNGIARDRAERQGVSASPRLIFSSAILLMSLAQA